MFCLSSAQWGRTLWQTPGESNMQRSSVHFSLPHLAFIFILTPSLCCLILSSLFSLSSTFFPLFADALLTASKDHVHAASPPRHRARHFLDRPRGGERQATADGKGSKEAPALAFGHVHHVAPDVDDTRVQVFPLFQRYCGEISPSCRCLDSVLESGPL